MTKAASGDSETAFSCPHGAFAGRYRPGTAICFDFGTQKVF